MAGKEYMTTGALIRCSNGVAPVPIIGIPHGVAAGSGGKLLLNATDYKPIMNIPPFGTCSMKPPTPPGANVCVPVTCMAWRKADMHCFIDGAPVLTKDSFCTCALGGTIKFV